MQVRVEARCVQESDNELPMETRAAAPSGSGINPIRLDWSHRLPLYRDSRAWERLGLALSGAANASDV